MRSKGYLLSTARLILGLALSVNITGCGKFLEKWPKEEIPKHLQETLSTYNIPATVHIHGHTLWVYCPIEDTKPTQKTSSSNKLVEQINDALFAISRVLWNSHSEDIKFYGLLLANISSGFLIYIIGTTQDIRDFYLEKIPVDELPNRRIIDKIFYPAIIGDKEGENFPFFDISMVRFICQLIVFRVQSEYPNLYLTWNDKQTSSGNYICTFLVNNEDEQTIEKLKNTIKDVFQTYDFRKIQYISIQTPSREIILTPEEVFGKEGSPKGDKQKR